MGGDVLVMRQEELNRLEIIKEVIGKKITQMEASKLIGISLRQVQRIVSKVKEFGEKGIIHQGRGKSNCRRIKEVIKGKIIRIYERRYKDFGATLAVEKLGKHEGIKISRETLRKWLRQGGYEAGRRRRRKHRLWRERKEFYGEMVQMDGSHHDWLEGRGAKLVLMGYIDDATSRGFGRFYEYEGTIPAMDSFKRYILKYGIPTSVYLDRHRTYKSTHYDEWKAKVFGEEPPLSQFERALKELGVKVIHANSAPAKGRIERFFRTLQDRLVKELRLANAKTLEEANEVLEKYLIEHNGRYMIEPMKAANIHRKSLLAAELNEILCIKNEHPLRNDFTIVHEKKLYQMMKYTGAKRLEVRNRLDGTMTIWGNGRELEYKEIDQLPVKKRSRLSRIKSPVRILDKNRSWGTIGIRKRPNFSYS